MSSNNDTKRDKTQQILNSTKQNDESSPDNVEVHSANSWETAELGGDEARKSKFLRLMGAGKNKEHHSPIVIGDHNPTHERSKMETEKMTSELENQYQQSLCHKLSGGARAHLGFGFQDEKNKETTHNEEPLIVETLQEKCDKEGEKRKIEESTTVDTESSPSAEKKIKFVKSSS